MAYPTSAAGLESWLEAGLQAHRQGDLDRALAAYRQILAAAPDHAGALRLLGTGLLQAGQPDQAAGLLERAARRQPKDPHLLGNLAQAYLALKRYADAGETFRKASRLAPGEVQFQVGVAAALAMEGKIAEAEAALKRQAARFPNAPLVWFNLGNVLRDTQRIAPAVEAYRKAVALDPRMTEARNSLGSALHSLLRFAEAEQEYRACIEIAPDFVLPLYNLAVVLLDLGRFVEAESLALQVVARMPAASGGYTLMGTALGQQGRLLEALSWCRKAARIAPDDHQVAQTYGTALMEGGIPTEGLRWLAHAETIAPNSIALKQLTARALLAHGCLADGWTDYAQRPAAVELREKHSELELVQTLPAALGGAHVCVLAEQGLGDQLFFLRYAPLLAARGARVTYGPSSKLHTLLQRVPSLAAVFSESVDLPRADVHVLAGDLPRVLYDVPASAIRATGARAIAQQIMPEFERRIGVFWPPAAPTLRIAALPTRLADLRERLATFGPPPYIGLTWRAGTAPAEQRTVSRLLFKSISLDALGGVLRNVRGSFVALQRKPDAGEIEALSTAIERPLLDLTALNNDDLEGMLAVLALLDEYVAVSNTNVHLRAAAGRDTRVLVPAPAEWRWLQSGGSSPWFPACTIYRQSLQGDWSAAFGRLERDLEARIGRR